MIISLYSALGFAALLFLLLPSKRLPPNYRWLLAVLLLALTQLPIDAVTLAGHWQASVGELSIVTTLLLLTMTWRRLRSQRPLLPAGTRKPLIWLGVFALVFYPISMGAAHIDPYRAGFSPMMLTVAVLLLSLWAWSRGQLALVAAVSLATLAYAFAMLPSDNYWDYLFDPLLAVFSMNLAIRRAWRRWRFRRRKDQRQREAAVA